MARTPGKSTRLFLVAAVLPICFLALLPLLALVETPSRALQRMRSDWVTTALPRSGAPCCWWVGRVVVNPKRVNPATIRTYSDLAKPALKGQFCLRNRQSPYIQSLVADQMIQRGEASTRAWIKGMTNNVTQPFFSSDAPLVRAVALMERNGWK